MPVKVKTNTVYTNGRDSFRVVVVLVDQSCFYIDPEDDSRLPTAEFCSINRIKKWAEREATPDEIDALGWKPFSAERLSLYQMTLKPSYYASFGK